MCACPWLPVAAGLNSKFSVTALVEVHLGMLCTYPGSAEFVTTVRLAISKAHLLCIQYLKSVPSAYEPTLQYQVLLFSFNTGGNNLHRSYSPEAGAGGLVTWTLTPPNHTCLPRGKTQCVLLIRCWCRGRESTLTPSRNHRVWMSRDCSATQLTDTLLQNMVPIPVCCKFPCGTSKRSSQFSFPFHNEITTWLP